MTDYTPIIDRVLSDPATSRWLKAAIEALMLRDPTNALVDAKRLETLMLDRLERMSRGMTP